MGLHVAYSTDENYAVHTAVSMLTLFKTNSDFQEIVVHVLDNGITTLSKDKLLQIAEQYNRKVIFYNINAIEKIGIKINNSVKKLAISAYGRIFLSSFLKDINKVIYMDCDSVITGSLNELWNMDIVNYSIAGVLDNCKEEAKTRIGLDLKDVYINSGFMVMNLEKIRAISGEEKMINFIKSYNGDVYHHDQGIINGVFKNDIMILEPKYNVMTPFFDMNVKRIKDLSKTDPYYSQSELNEAKSNPIFVHFTPSYSKRPWFKGCIHPLKSVYLESLSETPWKGLVLKNDNRKLRIKVMEITYNILPFWIYKNVVGVIDKIKTIR